MTKTPIAGARPENSYTRYWTAPFNRPEYYPLDRRPDPGLYRPIGGWMGRLILPPPEQRDQVRGVLIEIHHTPAGHEGLLGTLARLRWADTAQNNKIYWSLTRQVLFDDRARKAAADGTLLPERLHGLTLVNPFESLAGAHPHDDMIVRLPEPVTLDATPADGGDRYCLFPANRCRSAGVTMHSFASMGRTTTTNIIGLPTLTARATPSTDLPKWCISQPLWRIKTA